MENVVAGLMVALFFGVSTALLVVGVAVFIMAGIALVFETMVTVRRKLKGEH